MEHTIEDAKDLGQITKDPNSNFRDQIHQKMKDLGYDGSMHDYCNEKKEGNFVFFKYIHHSVPSAARRGYYKVEFVDRNDS